MKHLKNIFEDFGEPYNNSIFKIRIKSVNDLSNKRAPDSIRKPVNDVLDGMEVGDNISGKSRDGKEHVGNIVEIKKDENGENVAIEIEEAGIVVELVPSSVKFTEGGDIGNKGGDDGTIDTGNSNLTFNGYDDFPGTRNNESLKNIKAFENFQHNIKDPNQKAKVIKISQNILKSDFYSMKSKEEKDIIKNLVSSPKIEKFKKDNIGNFVIDTEIKSIKTVTIPKKFIFEIKNN